VKPPAAIATCSHARHGAGRRRPVHQRGPSAIRRTGMTVRDETSRLGVWDRSGSTRAAKGPYSPQSHQASPMSRLGTTCRRLERGPMRASRAHGHKRIVATSVSGELAIHLVVSCGRNSKRSLRRRAAQGTPSAVEQQTSVATATPSTVASCHLGLDDSLDHEGGRGTRRSIDPQGVLMNTPPDGLLRSSKRRGSSRVMSPRAGSAHP
jgi:hypothetical protein